MDYIKIRFGDDLDDMGSRFEKTLEQMFRSVNPMFSLSEQNWSPQMDIYETPEEVIIRAEIAGVDKENLQVEINNRAVQISGSRSEPRRVPGGTYRLAEIQYGTFERILYLPAPIDTEVVSSSYVNGFLQLRLAKLPPAKIHKVTIDEE
jgi:HSP20 family protein